MGSIWRTGGPLKQENCQPEHQPCWGVFGSSYRCTKSEVSTRGISVIPLALLIDCVLRSNWIATCSKDLANQIRHWDVYLKEVAQCKALPGSFLSPAAAEWFSGLGLIQDQLFECSDTCRISICSFAVLLLSLRFQVCHCIGLTRQLGKSPLECWSACCLVARQSFFFCPQCFNVSSQWFCRWRPWDACLSSAVSQALSLACVRTPGIFAVGLRNHFVLPAVSNVKFARWCFEWHTWLPIFVHDLVQLAFEWFQLSTAA